MHNYPWDRFILCHHLTFTVSAHTHTHTIFKLRMGQWDHLLVLSFYLVLKPNQSSSTPSGDPLSVSWFTVTRAPITPQAHVHDATRPHVILHTNANAAKRVVLWLNLLRVRNIIFRKMHKAALTVLPPLQWTVHRGKGSVSTPRRSTSVTPAALTPEHLSLSCSGHTRAGQVCTPCVRADLPNHSIIDADSVSWWNKMSFSGILLIYLE